MAGVESGASGDSEEPDAHDSPETKIADSGAKIVLHRPRLKSENSGISSEGRLVVFTAIISAIAALAGASIGAFVSYQVAKSNSAHETKAAQVTRRQTTYAEFLGDEIDCRDYAQALVDGLEGKPSNPLIPGGFQLLSYDALRGKAKKVEYIVSLDDSVGVEKWRQSISSRQENIYLEIKKMYDPKTRNGRKVDRPLIDKLANDVNDLAASFHEFSVAARADLLPGD